MSAKADVEAAIHRFFQAMDMQDLERMADVVAHDAEMVHIGTDTGEVWRGWEELRAATVEQFEELQAYDADVQDLHIQISASGTVAWYAHRLDARIVSDGRVQTWTGARFTGVFERRGGQWKMVQTHVSLPESAGA